MTVSTTTNKVSYIGNGVAKEFSIPFPFLEQAHLSVHQLLNNIQTMRTDWTVSGGNIVFAAAPAGGAHIVIMREVPLTQETDYHENEILAAETLERNFDQLTMQIQQLKEKSDRAVTVDVFENTQASELLPSIRASVSTAAGYANSAQEQAQTSAQQAQNAALSAVTAAQQATVATNKAAEAASTLASKANKDMDNLSNAGKQKIAFFSLPSNRYVDYSLDASGTVYTAPSNGWFFLKKKGFANQYTNIVNNTTKIASETLHTGETYSQDIVPCCQGDNIISYYTSTGPVAIFRFIYAQGAY